MFKLLRFAAISLFSTLLVAGCAATPATSEKAGFDAYQRQDYKTAYQIWLPLAEQGNAHAQVNLGVMYRNGRGVEKNEAEALKWYRRAADQGDASGEYNTGLIYDNGWGVPQSYTESAKWFRLAAMQGNADAMTNLGACYAGGDGVPQDYVQAYKWGSLAADRGNATAAKNRDAIISRLSPAQLAEAKQLVAAWKPGQP